ncbi:hypothetical protein H2201_000313 [Coniosporium apollinis]|uniref:Xylanolytic transcriptional activator regulatory domain-containing protein n=1 Tax=Coniosporium apollinis TaxID=61459 RepID=A0ABQ9P638_9PEZI|nr:hypothetical protein H2201_000313 [Coniosporium apollinis]
MDPAIQARQANNLQEEGIRASDHSKRKTRCDPGLPRCGPCERSNSHCEYYDPAKDTKIPRNYVIHLQQKVRNLEEQLARLENDELDPDPEDVMRDAAAVKVQDSNESKYLGPSSGIAITRLVMQLAKEFTDSKSISDIVPDASAQSIKARFAQEDTKPTSKVYPMVSDVAAEELPNRELTGQLVKLFYMKVHPMYPIFHEPSFDQDVEDVFNGSEDPAKNFCLRMVIAISLQKMDTQYAGLADAYYLAALKYFERAVKPMNLRTLQCFALIAGYSLLTPTRTAVYYIIGLAVRLTQALGFNEEKTIILGRNGQRADPLEVDMRRRVFWIILVMEYGLSHSLGRPSNFATALDHFDVGFFEIVEDQYITPDGILPAPQASMKKWISQHFFKMRLLQLEIRRKLYQRKRSEPKNDQDPWFKDMEAKLIAWRDTSPPEDAGSGLNKAWFIGRYNTMVVFLFRPSPQVPRPSPAAAVRCYDACQFNIHMQREQIETRNVDLTWIFTQSLFMAINTMLWSLSYEDVRRQHSREDVMYHLDVALEAVELASVRWPGVASALELYRNLIGACIKVYDKHGDIPIAANSPSDMASVTGPNRSRTTSPVTVSSISLATPPERSQPPFGFISPEIYGTAGPVTSAGGVYQTSPSSAAASPSYSSAPMASAQPVHSSRSSIEGSKPMQYHNIPNYDPNSALNPLPATFSELPSWNPSFTFSQGQDTYNIPAQMQTQSPGYADLNGYFTLNPYAMPYQDLYGLPSWTQERSGNGLTQAEQMELMRSLETEGTGQIDTMIQESYAVLSPRAAAY